MCGRQLFNLETHRFALTLILMQEIPAWLTNLLRWVSTFLIESLGELANVLHAYNPSTQEVEARKLGIQGHSELHIKFKVNLRLWRGGGERRKRKHRDGCSGAEKARLRNCQSSKEPPPDTKTPPSFPMNLMMVLMLRKGVFPCGSCLSHLASEPLRRACENILEVKLNCEGEAVPVSIPVLA